MPSLYSIVSSFAEEEPDSSDKEEEESEDEAEWMRKLIAGKLSKGEKLVAVDHAAVQYPPFRCGWRCCCVCVCGGGGGRSWLRHLRSKDHESV